MKCLIVEDELISRTSLELLCEKIDNVEVKAVSNGEEAKRLLDTESFDLLFLDVELPGMSGLELIRYKDNMPPIVITSGSKVHAFDAFELDVIDYIQKPVSYQRLLKAFDKIKFMQVPRKNSNVEPAGDDSIFVRSNGKHVKLHLSQIYFIESLRDYVIFRTEEKRYIVHSTLKNIEERLSQDGRFLKVHRSYIVNTDCITDYDDRTVYLHDHEVPVSRSNKQALREQLNQL